MNKKLIIVLGAGLLALSACTAALGTSDALDSGDSPPNPVDAPAESDVGQSDDPFAGVNLQFNPSFWPDTDFTRHTIDYGEVVGLLRADQITPIDNPSFEPVSEANTRIADQEPVIAFDLDGDARAYQLSILTWHEIVNDTVGGRPVAVTYCPLCNSAIVFDRTVDGQELTFGTTGNLRNSDLVMWDRQTSSWWQQFTGEAIVGDFAGTQLEFIPSQVVSWADFKEAFPDGQALVPAGGRTYGRNPYVGYDTNSSPFAFQGEIDDRLFPVARVLGLLNGGEVIAYPFETLAEVGVVNDTVGGDDVALFFQPGQVSALDGGSIENSREVGSAAAYSALLDGDILTFSHQNEVIIDDQTDSRWKVFGQAIEGPLAGSELEPLLAYPHFWFAWAAFQPDTEVWGLT